MSWAYGLNKDGREVGYGVEAACDFPDCQAVIDRGLDYCCGEMHDGGDFGCGKYFCPDHLTGYIFDVEGSEVVCEACEKAYYADHPEQEEASA